MLMLPQLFFGSSGSISRKIASPTDENRCWRSTEEYEMLDADLAKYLRLDAYKT